MPNKIRRNSAKTAFGLVSVSILIPNAIDKSISHFNFFLNLFSICFRTFFGNGNKHFGRKKIIFVIKIQFKSCSDTKWPPWWSIPGFVPLWKSHVLHDLQAVFTNCCHEIPNEVEIDFEKWVFSYFQMKNKMEWIWRIPEFLH